MAANNLRRYVFESNRRRHRDDRISLMVAFAISMLTLVLGQPERIAALVGLATLAICVTALTLYASDNAGLISADERAATSGKHGLLYSPVSRRLALVSAAAIALLAAWPGVAEAALERKLRRLTARVPLGPDSIDEITRTLDQAAALRVRLPNNIDTVVSALHQTAKLDQNLSAGAINAGSAAAAASTVNIDLPEEMRGKMFSSLPKGTNATGGIWGIPTETGEPDSYSIIGKARQEDAARIMPITLLPYHPDSQYGPAFFVVTGPTATLDGEYLKNVVFRNIRVVYHGGPVILKNVYFLDCQFQVDSNEQSWRLLSSVIKGGWVTFSSDSQGGPLPAPLFVQ